MKDIQREVKALEVAMQVATDIQDKSYAYAVTRIQEALLGNIPSEVPRIGTGDWLIRMVNTCPGIGLVIETPLGEANCYRLPVSSSLTNVTEFIEAFSSDNEDVRGTWQVSMPHPNGGAVYLEYGKISIPLGAIPKGTVERRIIDSLSKYLAYCGRKKSI